MSPEYGFNGKLQGLVCEQHQFSFLPPPDMATSSAPFKTAPSRWPRGSEWRRWDLHVHTPESRLGTPFKGLLWADYVAALEKAAQESKISVIGITDYMTIDGYEKLVVEKISTPILVALIF